MTKTIKTYKNVELRLSQEAAQMIIIALQVERNRWKDAGSKKATTKYNNVIEYVRRQLKEAQTPNEVDELIHKIAEWP